MSFTLTNYWWLLIWLFLGGFLCSYIPKRRELLNGRTEERWSPFAALLLVLPYIIWAAYRSDSFGDTGLYRSGFLNAEASLGAAFSILTSDSKDVGFYALRSLIKMIIGNNDELFFLLIAAFQILGMAVIYRRYAADYWMCVFLFVASTDYLSWPYNGIRQYIAVIMIFACFSWMLQKRYIPLIVVILLASTIHGSALLMLPIIFIVQGEAWNAKTILMLLATAVIVVFVDRFTPILNELLQETQYDDMMTNEIWTQDDGTNIIRVLVYSVPALLSLFGLRFVRAANDPVINLSVNCSIVTMAVYLIASVSSGIYIGRLPIYTTLQGYIALPWLIDHIFEERSARLAKIIAVIMYSAFFAFQTFVIWNL